MKSDTTSSGVRVVICELTFKSARGDDVMRVIEQRPSKQNKFGWTCLDNAKVGKRKTDRSVKAVSIGPRWVNALGTLDSVAL